MQVCKARETSIIAEGTESFSERLEFVVIFAKKRLDFHPFLVLIPPFFVDTFNLGFVRIVNLVSYAASTSPPALLMWR